MSLYFGVDTSSSFFFLTTLRSRSAWTVDIITVLVRPPTVAMAASCGSPAYLPSNLLKNNELLFYGVFQSITGYDFKYFPAAKGAVVDGDFA